MLKELKLFYKSISSSLLIPLDYEVEYRSNDLIPLLTKTVNLIKLLNLENKLEKNIDNSQFKEEINEINLSFIFLTNKTNMFISNFLYLKKLTEEVGKSSLFLKKMCKKKLINSSDKNINILASYIELQSFISLANHIYYKGEEKNDSIFNLMKEKYNESVSELNLDLIKHD